MDEYYKETVGCNYLFNPLPKIDCFLTVFAPFPVVVTLAGILLWWYDTYHQVSNISRTLVGN